ncbi:DNA repair protein RadA [Fusobacterium perfoetens]|uniref:DNA repair protein RadA n=1 Tax=Fusobacterium perfoetens TaxID=852 RepID=UPI0004869ECB|nr:DNA repair protein RadA [Fusobacterium perfoetens]MCI6151706.1 DNA repair protein RadA [Fusobacterium perfoetens]MDY3236538.1 DNA repair protein RadA [Fusobacterium perfoetens]
MKKENSMYICKECGYKSVKWLGKCPNCGEWGSLEIEEEKDINVGNKKITKQIFSEEEINKKIISFNEIEMEDNFRYKTRVKEFDRILGGGLVQGEVILLTGNPGIGKSTLLLQMANEYTRYGEVFYISGEESLAQIKNRGERLGIKNNKLFLISETNIDKIYEYVAIKKPKVVIVDSIQTLFSENSESTAGAPTQIREATLKIVDVAKKNNICFFIVGHITKDGKVAGPKMLEHMVDAVFNFEGEEGLFYRILRSEKNRFGSTNEIAIFSMEEDGLKEIQNSSEYFISERNEKNIGSIIVPVLEGTKVFLLEIQTLITEGNPIGIPKRVVQGFDRNRIQILMAIGEKRMGINLGNKDVFVNIPGGLSIKDPSADLGVLISLLSVYKNVEISQKIAAIGELGLRGEIRKVFFIDKRLRELEKLGFKGVYVPESNRKEIEKKQYNLKLIYLKNLDEFLERI